tara:strand:- start:722 stop:1684 length:963 start_codon:yes stop_codon:yes gene_type:complete
MKLRAGVIGVGAMGRHHVRVYSELDSCELVAVSDFDESVKGIAEEKRCGFYKNYEEMLSSEKLDVVSVCVPTKLHAKVALDCIKHDVNVLVEKPISDNIEDGKRIIEAAEGKKLKLGVGHIERHNPAVKKLKEVIDEGKIGKIISIAARRVGLFPPRVKDVNILVDLAVHDIDVANYLIGKEPDDVYCNAGNALTDGRKDYAELFLNYGGVSAVIQTNWITPVKIRTLNVTGTKGYAELDYVTQSLVLYESNYERTFDDFGEFVVKFGEHSKVKVEVEKEEPLRLEILDFLECVQNDRCPMVSGEEALNALKIALDAGKV